MKLSNLQNAFNYEHLVVVNKDVTEVLFEGAPYKLFSSSDLMKAEVLKVEKVTKDSELQGVFYTTGPVYMIKLDKE